LKRDTTSMARRGDVQGLLALLGHRRWSRRLGAALELRRFPGERTEAALLGALQDPSFFVSTAALHSLVALDAHRPVEPVIRGLRRRTGDDEAEWRPPDAREILGRRLLGLKALRPVETLIAALEDGSLVEDNERMTRMNKMLALHVLADARDPRAGEQLTRALGDSDPRIRRAAANALRRRPGRRPAKSAE
jgi:HEAT repeat protein